MNTRIRKYEVTRQYEIIAAKYESGWVEAVPALAEKRRHALHQACLLVALALMWSQSASYHDRARDLRYMARRLER